jgi:hypothetical protein
MKNVNLQLRIEEANLILEALGNMPFKKVYALIAKIQEQASQQLEGNGGPAEGDEPDQPVQMKDQADGR